MERGDFILSNVDKRVVQMEFDNKQFEKDMQATVKSLRNFENNLNSIGGSSKAFDGITKGLADVKSNVKGFNLSPISDAFDKVKVTISGW
jgi:archaellum component FlaC